MDRKVIVVWGTLWDVLPEGKKIGGTPLILLIMCRSSASTARLSVRGGDDRWYEIWKILQRRN